MDYVRVSFTEISSSEQPKDLGVINNTERPYNIVKYHSFKTKVN